MDRRAFLALATAATGCGRAGPGTVRHEQEVPVTDSDRIVAEFFRACERMRADELIEYFAPDAIYHNIPLPLLRGRTAIWHSLAGLSTRFRRLRIETRHQVAMGEIVMNERVDTFTFPDGAEVALPIAGVLELRGGRIHAWREYFDLATFQRR